MAELARLELSDDEIVLYQADLNRFLLSGAELQKVDTAGVEFISYVGKALSRMR